jgi:hypothetical protein
MLGSRVALESCALVNVAATSQIQSYCSILLTLALMATRKESVSACTVAARARQSRASD